MNAFVAPAWARNAHLQTVWAPLVRRLTPPPRRTERLELADGDFLRLDFVGDTPAAPLLIILHGLAGSGDSVYIIGIQRALQQVGIDSVNMYFRSAGGEPNRLARSYHAGDTGDLAALVAALQQRWPGRPMAALGYSLGGSVLLKYLGERGSDTPLRAACSVSSPLSLAACADQLDVGFARIYRNRLLKELLGNTIAKEKFLRAAGSLAEADRLAALGAVGDIHTFREFDGRIIAPLHGFRDANDYYEKSSARQFLPAIRVPTRIIHAVDDPFMTPAVAPLPHEVSASTELSVSAQGGHVGFVAGTPWRPRYWLEETLPAWFVARLG